MCRRDRPYSTHCTNSVLYISYLHILESLLLNSVCIYFVRRTVQLLVLIWFLWIIRSIVEKLMLSIPWKTTWSSTIWVWISFKRMALLTITIFTRAVSCSAVRSLLPPIDGCLSVLQKWKDHYWIMVIHDCGTLKTKLGFNLYALQHYIYDSNKANYLFSLLKIRTLDETVWRLRFGCTNCPASFVRDYLSLSSSSMLLSCNVGIVRIHCSKAHEHCSRSHLITL